MLRLLIVAALSISALSEDADKSVDSLTVIGAVPPGAFCHWKAVDKVPLSREACKLAHRFGDSEQWVKTPGQTRLAFRIAIHRAFLLPSIIRIEIESSTKATLTQTYGVPTQIDNVIDLSPNEIRMIVRDYQRADLWSMPASTIGPECPFGSLAVLDVAVASRFRTIVSCAEKTSAMNLLVGIDEIVRSHLR